METKHKADKGGMGGGGVGLGRQMSKLSKKVFLQFFLKLIH